MLADEVRTLMAPSHLAQDSLFLGSYCAHFPSRVSGHSFASMPIVVAYPLMKRFTWWPQAVLGKFAAISMILSIGPNVVDQAPP